VGGTQWDDALLTYARVAPPPAAASSTAASSGGPPWRRLLAANGGGLGDGAHVDDVSMAEAAMRDPTRLGTAFWSPVVRAFKNPTVQDAVMPMSLCRRCLMLDELNS
jgi:hypothetical protein